MTVNNQSQPEIHISEAKLRKLGWILLGLAVVFTIIGAFVSPSDDNGKPVLLSPEIKEVEEYRESVKSWISDLTTLDGEISNILSSQQQGDLFSQSRSAQQTLKHAVALAQEIDQVKVPPIGTGLQEKMSLASTSYLETARQALLWVSAPEESGLELVNQELEESRKLKSDLEKNQWLISP